MKSKKSFDKLRGGYYTPQAITEFICKWIINKNTKNILEPSCGDGNFLKKLYMKWLESFIKNFSKK